MIEELKIQAINKVLKQYFEKHLDFNKIQAKELMSEFINAGIFNSDYKAGLPIRRLLRSLDEKNCLQMIPYVLAERKSANTNWFFIKSDYKSDWNQEQKPLKRDILKEASTKSRDESDEYYILNLCDELLNQEASRQHKFDFLLGDPGKNGLCRKLPVDAYYQKLNLVIEYREQQHSEAIPHFDKPNVKTVSGVSRGEQRKIYDQRRRDVLKQQGIQLIEIDYSLFKFNGRKKLIRNKTEDLSILRELFKYKKLKC